jgi:hypothetical protein
MNIVPNKSMNIEPNPPWIEFPGEDFYWKGWRKGSGEPWLLSVFLPFWNKATSAERLAYLAKWPPHDEEWALWIAAIDQLAEQEETAWGKKAIEALAVEAMVGSEIFTNMLRAIANSET